MRLHHPTHPGRTAVGGSLPLHAAPHRTSVTGRLTLTKRATNVAAAPNPRPQPRLCLALRPARPPPAAAAATPSPSSAPSAPPSPTPPPKAVWLQTTNPAAAAAALEAGADTLVFGGPDPGRDAAAWRGLAAFRSILIGEERRAGDGAAPLTDDTGAIVGWQHPLPDAAAAAALAARVAGDVPGSPTTIAWAAPPPGAWSLIPTENLVAAAGGGGKGGTTRLFVSATTAAEASGLLGALEAGADGVVLVTDDPAVARAGGSLNLAAARPPTPRLTLVPALVTATAAAGMGDRVCVDLTTAMAPGEGLLVGSFARGLALVQAEVESGAGYVGTRPFRVNAGSLHSYVAAPGGKTAYLAELGAGDEVLIVDGRSGATRVGVVGRAKIERRPLVRVSLAVVPPAGSEEADAAVGGGDALSLMLQNAETVRLVGPAVAPLPPAAAEVVRWVKDGGKGGSGGAGGGASPPTTSLRAADSAALRWAMHSTDDSSGSEGDEEEEEEAQAGPRHAAAAPDAQDALAWLMRDQDGDGLPDAPDVDVSGMGDLWQGGSGGGKARTSPLAMAAEASTSSSSSSVSTPVSALLPGASAVWVWRAPAARHTGIAVEEAIEER